MDRSTHEVRIRQWAEIIKACNDSGLTKRQWCMENNVSEKNFYYWQRILRREACSHPSMQGLVPYCAEPAAFVELPVPAYDTKEPKTEKALSVIRFRNGMSMELSDSMATEFIRLLVKEAAHAE